MAQTVEFRLNLSVDGKEHVISTSEDVKQLSKELGLAEESGDSLRHSLLKINAINEAFQNAARGIQEMTGMLLDLTDTYATQQVNETRLANNMRNTMDARDEDIQSIKDLCSAQQQLGVVGDEVQLAGAQELATYLEKKSSLEALIPVMNDMLAQQYGLEASEESAAQIASMLGKVMEGQTAALSRYGYSFTEAQEQILKFGTEEERAAVLAEVVESSVGGMNEALRQTPSGQAKAAANALGDVKEAVGGVVAAIQPAIVITDKLVSGLNTIVTTSTGIIGAVNTIKSLTAALNLSATAARRVSIALKGLLISSGIGIAIWALSEAVSYFAGKTDEATDAMKRAEQEAKKLESIEEAGRGAYTNTAAALKIHTSRLEELIKAKKEGHDVSQDEKKIVGELNTAYGSTMGYFSSLEGWYKALIANSADYCRQMVIEAKTRTLANQIAEGELKERKMADNSQRMETLIKQVSGNRKKTAEYRQLREENRQLASEVANLPTLRAQMDEYVKEAASLSFKVKGAIKEPTGGKGNKGNKEKDKRYSLIENAATYKELANNVKYYEQQLEEANITDVETIQTLSQAKAVTEKAIEQFQKLSTVTKTDEQKREAELAELRASEVASLKHEEITTQDQLSAKMTYYNRLQQLGTEKDRLRAQEGIRELNAIAKAWDMVIDKSRFKLDETGEIDPSAIFNSEDIDAAIRFYTDRQQQEDADQVEKTQTLIDRLTERKTAIELGIELPSMKKEAEEIAALTGREYTIKVRSMGFDQIMAKIREIEELLDNPNITADQSQQLEQLRGIYGRFAKDSVRSLGTYKEAWSGIKGVGSGIESITQALEDNSNAWQKITALIDGFLQIADGIGAIVTITETLTKASQMETAADIAGAGAKKAKSAASLEATGVGAAEEAKNELVATSSGKEAAADLTSAGAKVMKAHAWLPWVGVAIGAGMVAMMIASISSVKNSMPKFATGGIVGGSSATGDRLLVRVNSGEMILNKHQQLMLWQLLNGQRSSLSAAAIQYNPPQVSLDVPALQSQLRPYSERVVVTGTLHGRGRDILATIETEQNHRKRS